MTSPIQHHPAKLFIPNKIDGGENALNWRLGLIDKEGIYDGQKLLNQFKLALGTKLERSEKDTLVAIARSSDIILDEIEHATLWVTDKLLQANTLSEDLILTLDQQSKLFLKNNSIKNRNEYIKRTRSNLKNHGETMLRVDVRKIRAKLAFQEIITLIAPDKMVPVMVAISTKYLASDFIQQWLRLQRYNLQNKSVALRTLATKNLEQLSKSITGDKRKLKKRQYSYWRMGLIYENLVAYIKGFRRLKEENEFDLEDFKIFCEVHKIPSIYETAILDSKRAPSQLALDIMVEQDLIDDPKAFREFQPHINKLQEKHFNCNVLSIANELSPILFHFMDLPTTHPDIWAAHDPFAVLERLPINPYRPNS